MCGHVGFLRKKFHCGPAQSISKALEQLLYMDTLRGFHGTGIQYFFREYDNNKKTHGIFRQVHKDAVPGGVFVVQKETQEAMRKIPDIIFMSGHNRYATRGAHTPDNTHPFIHNNICLSHNGVIRNSYQVNNKYFDVDSNAAAYSLGEGKTLQELVDVAEGAWCFVWSDLTNSSFHFYRNSERPLFFIHTEYGIFYGSEKYMVIAACERNNIKIEREEELPINRHVTFKVDPSAISNATKELLIRSEEDVIPKPKPVAVTNYHGGNGGHKGYYGFNDEDDWKFRGGQTKPPEIQQHTSILTHGKSVGRPTMPITKYDQEREDVEIIQRASIMLMHTSHVVNSIQNGRLRGRNFEPCMARKVKDMKVGETITFCYTDHEKLKLVSRPAYNSHIYQVCGEPVIDQDEAIITSFINKAELEFALEHKLMLIGEIYKIERIGRLSIIELRYARCTDVYDPLYMAALGEVTVLNTLEQSNGGLH